MAAPPDLNAILAALANGRPSTTPSATPQQPPQAQHAPPQGLPAGYPGAMPSVTPPTIPGYNFPPPTHSGSLDLSAIKPVSSGSVSIQDALAKARGFAAQKGLAHEARPGIPESWSGYGAPAQTYTTAAYQEDPRLSGRQSYRRSRSRSRSPVRREAARESYNPYRDERRDERRGGYGRERDRSPPRRDTFSPAQQYGQARSPPANDNSEVILIDSSLVGLVIGRQGESLRRIEQESQTRIQFINGPESGPQRECRITGSPSARISAKREINRIIEENGGNPARETGRNARPAAKTVGQQQPALREGEQSSQIMVPDRTVGLIIGRGGETIRDLQERSGCHVNIVGENKSVNGLRPVNLIGSPTAAAHAKELIMEIVDSDTKQMEGTGGQQPQPQQQFNNRRENFDPFAGAAAGDASGKINDSIQVPSDAVGMIIGKGGETIKSMQSETGCKINVSQASGADIEREIGLVGTRQAIEAAKRAIWDKVDQVREKNNSRRRDNGNQDNGYSQQQTQSYGQSAPPAQAPQAVAPAAGAAAAADPYAVYGGYQNYLAMWYASIAQQQGGQQGAQGPPGA
ncbi:kh domain-containing [Pyrenophora seminiperda CCB06]|uniref:Kh domain-containing n=1 Tax=Pyrenophora seminiperda CCB06 TaxID=1302712 RepID=A0A3M7M9V7_9PLEO|nr:kh domain-containing [Pyrenophora seminiperda CCB06]